VATNDACVLHLEDCTVYKIVYSDVAVKAEIARVSL